MSMQFQKEIDDETLALIRDKFGEPVAHDRKTLLFETMAEIRQRDMKEIANKAGQVATVELNGEGDIKEMSDGTKYQVTPTGWRRLSP